MSINTYKKMVGIKTAALVVPLSWALAVQALDTTWLTDDALIGRFTGFDGYLGTADDLQIQGFNTFGGASQFTSSDGAIFGFSRGTNTILGDTVFGLQNRVIFGSNVFSAVDISGEYSAPSLFIFNAGFSQSLDTNSPSLSFLNEGDQSFTNSLVMNDSVSGGRVSFQGTGHYLFSYQNAADLYGGDELTHFDFGLFRFECG